jgi:diaminohydroxyphosphoribosylaminopyrimidine deaminase/5-amino-6-(5-phosphoribosylamino)uracil reductase
VSLEPCAHHGQTGPCAQALIDAGVARVVSALEDPDPRVAGRGHAMLRSAGIDVKTGVMTEQARALNAGFLSRIQAGRPYVTLKIASTIDGRIALPSGESQWITGQAARAHVHLMRAQHDAVMTGIGTVLADDPELNCRLPGVDHSRSVRVVVDTRGRLPATSKLAQSAARQPVWCMVSDEKKAAFAVRGVDVLGVPAGDGGLDLGAGLKILAAEGLTRVLVEAGGKLAASLLKAKLVDELLWYRAPSVMGDGLGAVGGLGLALLSDMPRFARQDTLRLGDDVLETYRIGT